MSPIAIWVLAGAMALPAAGATADDVKTGDRVRAGERPGRGGRARPRAG